MAKPAEIYALCDPVTGDIRYIGKAQDSQKRLKSHLRDARRRSTPVYEWLNSLTSKGLLPSVTVLEVSENWEEAERRQIELSRARGDSLLNVSEGGRHIACTKEQRSANGHRMAQKLRDDPLLKKITEWKRFIARAINDGVVSNETRAKLRLAASKRPDLFGCWSNLPDEVEQ